MPVLYTDAMIPFLVIAWNTFLPFSWTEKLVGYKSLFLLNKWYTYKAQQAPFLCGGTETGVRGHVNIWMLQGKKCFVPLIPHDPPQLGSPKVRKNNFGLGNNLGYTLKVIIKPLFTKVLTSMCVISSYSSVWEKRVTTSLSMTSATSVPLFKSYL